MFALFKFTTGMLTVVLAIILTEAIIMADQIEGRAIWVVRTHVTNPEQVKSVVEFARKNNFNTLVVQVRGRGDAYYKSNFEPRAEAITDPNFDPLQCYIDEGKKAGLKIEAWLNTHYTWESAAPPKSPEHVVNKHPEWLMRTREDKVTMTGGAEHEGAYTCPSNPEVKEHVKNCFLDVAKNYDVAAIHFDFVRYPSPEYCFCDGCLSRFKERMDKQLAADKIETLEAMKDRLAYTQAFPAEYDQFRRDQITDLVGQIYKGAHAIKPGIIVSASVFPSYDDAYNRRFQDWKLWMKLGIVDELFPMAYAQDTETFVKNVKDAVENANGRFVYAGIGQWRIPVESTIEKIEKARELGVQGICLFAYGSAVKDSDDSYLAKIKESVFQQPAAVPAIPWLGAKK